MAEEFQSAALNAINQGIIEDREAMKKHVPEVLAKIEALSGDLQKIEDWMEVDVGFPKAQRDAVRQFQDQLNSFRTWLNTVRINRLSR